MNPGRFLSLIVAFACTIPLWEAAAFNNSQRHLFPYQDGSLVVEKGEKGLVFSFPYVPFLETEPAWTPALPRIYGQPQEGVRPLPGLAGFLRLGLVEEDGSHKNFALDGLRFEDQTPCSALLNLGKSPTEGKLGWAIAMGMRGVVFEYENPGKVDHTLRLELDVFPHKLHWATPQKKLRRDWGEPVWEWNKEERCLLQTYGNPMDATRSPSTALWIGESDPRAWKGEDITFSRDGSEPIKIEVKVPAGQSIRFGFQHADNSAALADALHGVRHEQVNLTEPVEEWETWFANAGKEISDELKIDFAKIPKAQEEIIKANLSLARMLFLSNGGLLTRPMTLQEYPSSVRDQAIALNHWRQLGLPIPSLDRWRDLARHNQTSERSIPIPTLNGGGHENIIDQGKILMFHPDPDFPPDKETFDALLGYAISGGHVTLVDGYHGFHGKEGWWKEVGVTDLADYALRLLGVPIDHDSREVLDEEGLSPLHNTFALGSDSLASAGITDGGMITTIFKTVEPGGYLIIHSSDSEDPEGAVLLSGRIGDFEFLPLTLAEDSIIAASYGLQTACDVDGRPIGVSLLGEAFTAYKLPEGITSECEITTSGQSQFAWSEIAPETHHTITKKAFPSEWWRKELFNVPISRAAHPVIYGGTYTSRVFDVTRTEKSPMLHHRIGRGSFVWIGLPKEYLTLGSDSGTDYDNWLRNDPTYDLVRFTLALHDVQRAGTERAGDPPNASWGEGWSQGDSNHLGVDLAYFAWRPFEFSGIGRGGNQAWFKNREIFLEALQGPIREGNTLPLTGLYASRSGSSQEEINLFTNACAYALYRNLAKVSAYQGRDWANDFTTGRAKRLADELTPWVEDEGVIFGRTLENRQLGKTIPVNSLLPEAVWAVTEIPAMDFPGGATEQAHLLSALNRIPVNSLDSRSLAALATRKSGLVSKLINKLGTDSDKNPVPLIRDEEGEFDIATALPAVHALCREYASPNKN